jgi:hypothetical protein
MNIINTHPRSGAHYLQNLILNYSSNYIEFRHKISLDDSTIITIARDPFDTIHSLLTMRKYYTPETYLDKDYNEEYVNTYNFLYNHAHIVIDYNDLVNYPDKVTEKVCRMLGLKNVPHNQPMDKDMKDIGYLVSSKTVKEYDDVHITKEDIQVCYEPYFKLLTKAIRLT